MTAVGRAVSRAIGRRPGKQDAFCEFKSQRTSGVGGEIAAKGGHKQ